MTSDWRANRVGNMQPGTGSSTTRVFVNDWFGGLFLSPCLSIIELSPSWQSIWTQHFNSKTTFLFFGSNRLGIGLECVWYRGAEVKLTVDWTNRKRITFYFLFPFLTHIFLYHQGISYFFFSCPCKLVCFLSAMVKGVKSFWTVYLHIFLCNCSFILSYQLWKYWRRQGTKKITVIFIFKHPTYLRADFDLSATIDKNLCILRLTCVTFSRKYRCKWLVRTEIKVKNKQANKQTNTNKQ